MTLMTEEEQELFDKLPSDGSYVTNPDLLRRLGNGWDSNRYWNIRNILVDRGVLAVARGRGGLIHRVVEESVVSEPFIEQSDIIQEHQILEREEDLYNPIRTVLDDQWAREKRLERWIAHITARQGRRDTGGRWSRPDLVIATQSTYPYIPGRHFDVITFEVKPFGEIDVRAVYEALGHLRTATKAYVLLHVPDGQAESLQEALIEVYSEAKKHGIGIITMNHPGNFDGWEETVEPIRREPEPRRLNDFLATVFEPTQRETLLRWFR